MKLITHNLVHELQALATDATHISWVVAFAMKSGVELMLPTLKVAQERGATIQLLVGNYLCITQPHALTLLHEALPTAEIRLYETASVSFHPKAYLFQHAAAQHVIVGSSNLSRSALTTGIEWSLHTVHEQTFEQAMTSFYELFYAPQTSPINTYTIARYEARYMAVNDVKQLRDTLSADDEQHMMYGTTTPVEALYETPTPITTPRPAQQLALDALTTTMAEGFNKAMVVLATGLGKTYVAAFFAKSFQRVLFVAHRDEILQQAQLSFSDVHASRSFGYYNSVEKAVDVDMTFASIYTLAQPKHLQRFARDHFDLIVVDEFHHAAAPTYKRLLQHFTPQFLLGITATPERLDHKDVYALCDGNVAINIHFIDAIARNWLSPFHYYGVQDTIDYRPIRWLGSHYDETQLFAAQSNDNVMHHMFKNWQRYRQQRTIAFCSSIRQAQLLCDYFTAQHVRAVILTGTHTRRERKTIREQLIDGAIDIIFTVDLFNEGVDIPSVDTLLFARPTESMTIFTQQLGRGLRLADGKSHCVVIDCIGNYRNVERKLQMLLPTPLHKLRLKPNKQIAIDQTASFIQLDVGTVHLLEELLNKQRSYKEQMLHLFHELKEELGRRPSYIEFYQLSGIDDAQVAREFRSYMHMLREANDLTKAEEAMLCAHETLLIEAEKTPLTKSYKMVLLQAMLARGNGAFQPMTAQAATAYFRTYLAHNARKKIDALPEDDHKLTRLIQTMPMTYWAASSKGLFTLEHGTFSFTAPMTYDATLHDALWQITELRLHRYFARKAMKL